MHMELRDFLFISASYRSACAIQSESSLWGGGLHNDQVSSISVSVYPRLFILTGSFDQRLSIIDLASSEDEAILRAYRTLTKQEPRGKHGKAPERSLLLTKDGQGVKKLITTQGFLAPIPRVILQPITSCLKRRHLAPSPP